MEECVDSLLRDKTRLSPRPSPGCGFQQQHTSAWILSEAVGRTQPAELAPTMMKW